MKVQLISLCFLLAIVGCKKENSSTLTPIPDQTEINKLKINQLQILGSHNSYHKHMSSELFSALASINFLLPAEYKLEGLDYDHEPLAIQLNTYGIRNFEIDIYADPQGGRYYNRQGNTFLSQPAASGIAKLNEPGFKVLHIPDIDFETHYYTFKDNLHALKDWSDAHPNHLPIFLHIETKEKTIGDVVPSFGFTTAIPFTPSLCDAIDAEIESVFGQNLDKVITPDKVRDTFPTLEQAVLAGNWPTVGESRGKFVFVMEGGAADDYLIGHPSLEGRAMFLYGDTTGNAESAILIYNNSISYEAKIKSAVEKGYIVRTRADGPNVENRTGNYDKQNAAFRSGAQIVTTDYYRPDPRYLTDPVNFKNYSCRFPNGVLARINAVSAPDKQNAGIIAE